jgi:P27 family predicted phage terminase small subunit
MPVGRPPRPIEQHIRNGTYRADRHGRQPVLIGGRPELAEWAEPPDDLPEDGKAFWRDTVVRLIECGICDRVDVPLLEALAVQWARAVQAGRVLEEEGHFVKGSTGQLVKHPAIGIERDATALFWRMAESFGIGPLARTRLGLAELHRRSLGVELREALGNPDLRPAE